MLRQAQHEDSPKRELLMPSLSKHEPGPSAIDLPRDGFGEGRQGAVVLGRAAAFGEDDQHDAAAARQADDGGVVAGLPGAGGPPPQPAPPRAGGPPRTARPT